MTSITTNVHRVRTTGSEHQGQNSISDPDLLVFFHQVCKKFLSEPSGPCVMLHPGCIGCHIYLTVAINKKNNVGFLNG